MHLLCTWLLLLICTWSCKKGPDIDRECHVDISAMDFTFGIDYENPDPYLIPGEQSKLSDIYQDEIQDLLGIPEDSMVFILEVCEWINRDFTFENTWGAMVGLPVVDELYELKVFYGCHSQALLVSSILREFGFPAILIETADVQWAYNYHEGSTDMLSGHVMSEILVGGNWILLDNDGSYVEVYDPNDPFISTRFPSKGLFVVGKGLDTWDYAGKDEDFTQEKLIYFSDNIYCFEEMLNTTDYEWK